MTMTPQQTQRLAAELLRTLATRADWEGIDNPDFRKKYSREVRLMAKEAVKPHAVKAFEEGGVTWRAPLLFAARDLDDQ